MVTQEDVQGGCCGVIALAVIVFIVIGVIWVAVFGRSHDDQHQVCFNRHGDRVTVDKYCGAP